MWLACYFWGFDQVDDCLEGNAGANVTYLGSQRAQSLPVQARQDVADEGQVELRLDHLELGVARVQRERGGARLACFAGAGEEVEREELHFRVELFFSFFFRCPVLRWLWWAAESDFEKQKDIGFQVLRARGLGWRLERTGVER